MKSSHTAALAAAAFLLEPTAAGLVSCGGKAPDLLLCLVITAVFSRGDAGTAIGIAVMFAALQDLCFHLYAGPGAAAVFLAGLLAAAALRYCAWDRLSFFLAFTLVDTLLYQLVLWAGTRFLGAYTSFFSLIRLLPLSLFYNLAIMVPIYCKFLKRKKGAEDI